MHQFLYFARVMSLALFALFEFKNLDSIIFLDLCGSKDIGKYIRTMKG